MIKSNKELNAKSKEYITFPNMFWLFMIGNVFGVLLEGTFCRLVYGYWETHVVSMWGPFCLIYGFGMVIIYITCALLYDKNIVLRFLAVAFFADICEYFCGWLIDEVLDMYAWNYSNYFMNLNGLICLRMTLAWGVVGLLFERFAMPKLRVFFDKVNGKIWKYTSYVTALFMVVNIAFTTQCLIRWSERHFNIEPKNSYQQMIDAKYDDSYMQNRFIEWHFIKH